MLLSSITLATHLSPLFSSLHFARLLSFLISLCHCPSLGAILSTTCAQSTCCAIVLRNSPCIVKYCTAPLPSRSNTSPELIASEAFPSSHCKRSPIFRPTTTVLFSLAKTYLCKVAVLHQHTLRRFLSKVVEINDQSLCHHGIHTFDFPSCQLLDLAVSYTFTSYIAGILLDF